MAVRKRKTDGKTKAAPRRTKAAPAKASRKRKHVGDVLGLGGSRPPKPAKPVKTSTGKRRRRTGLETRRRRPAQPQARVLL